MKCISLWQPWASLMAIGAKRIETRSWPTNHRGLLAIQSAKRTIGQIPGLLDIIRKDWEAWSKAFEGHAPIDYDRKIIGFGGLPLGCVVAVVTVDGCRKTEHVGEITSGERAFGDYAPGRWGWNTTGLHRLAVPVPCVGHQGIFNLPPDVEAAVLAQIGGAE